VAWGKPQDWCQIEGPDHELGLRGTRARAARMRTSCNAEKLLLVRAARLLSGISIFSSVDPRPCVRNVERGIADMTEP
jgi:hypothetical protein